MMFCRAMVWILLGGLLLATGGCVDSASQPSQDGHYRTITTQPLRDTDAAKTYNQAGRKYLAAGELDKAAAEFTRALTADVEFGPAHNNLGKVYYLKKEWYKAAWEFDHACRLLPKHAEPRNNMAMVFEEAGELERALDFYRQAVALDRDNYQYRANLVRALTRRGDRTTEVRNLLRQVVNDDPRPEWREWARRQQEQMGS